MPTPIYLFEDSHFSDLFPLTLSRPSALLRCGGFTLLERFIQSLQTAGLTLSGLIVRPGLVETLRARLDIPVNPAIPTKDGIILVNARLLATTPFALPASDTAGLVSDAIVYLHLSPAKCANLDFAKLLDPRTLEALLPTVQRLTAPATLISHPWDLLEHNHSMLLADFRTFGPAQLGTLLPGVHLLAPDNMHIAHQVKIYPGVVLDAQNGPIIIDSGAEIRSNAVLTGPVYIGKNCLVRTGADIREDTVLGPGSRVGGEVIGSILLANSNKQHHGFLGQSLLGEWVNLGAGTTTSNLKNTYGNVRMPINGSPFPTNRLFLGSVIADHAKIAIGTYLSTGTVIGFSSHILTAKPPQFVPSFAWVTAPAPDNPSGIARIDFAKATAIAQTVLSRRGIPFTPADLELFVRIAGEYAAHESYDWPQPPSTIV